MQRIPSQSPQDSWQREGGSIPFSEQEGHFASITESETRPDNGCVDPRGHEAGDGTERWPLDSERRSGRVDRPADRPSVSHMAQPPALGSASTGAEALPGYCSESSSSQLGRRPPPQHNQAETHPLQPDAAGRPLSKFAQRYAEQRYADSLQQVDLVNQQII